MILRYSLLRHKPGIFKTMTGLSVALFDELVWDLEQAYAQATVARRERPGRTRAVGAGHPCSLSARDEFLLTVIWLRHYFTQEGWDEAGPGTQSSACAGRRVGLS